MIKLIALTLVPAFLLTGCPLCGGYAGADDYMYRRGNDALMLCDNRTYVLMLADGTTHEGVYQTDATGLTGTGEPTGEGADGPTGARMFTISFNADGTVTFDGLGDGAWLDDTQFANDKVARDHADVQCTDVTTRSWYASVGELPAATAFSKAPDAFATVADCKAAQAQGDVPPDALCEDQVLLCPDGSARVNTGSIHTTGTYTANLGVVSVQPFDNSFTEFSGVFAMAGTLTTGGAQGATGAFVWHSIPATSLANGLACQ